MRTLRITLFLASILASSSAVSATEALSAENYEKEGKSKAVVVLHVNWGRQWRCAGSENAQLQAIEFSKMSGGEALVSLKTPSKLSARNAFVPYVLLIEPGEYAISAFDVKVARSVSDVGHLKGGNDNLFKDGKPIGGSFSAAAGEVVYVGHFGLDCAKEPIPWRYYVEGREEFDAYVTGFRKEFPFLENKPVEFRLFSTEIFGQAYVLE